MHHGVVSSGSTACVITHVMSAVALSCEHLILPSGHCKKLAPAWGELGQSFENVSDVVVAHVDCTQAKKVCSDAKVSCWFQHLQQVYSCTCKDSCTKRECACRLVVIPHLSCFLMVKSKKPTEVGLDLQ